MDILIPSDAIHHRVTELAHQIAHDYQGRPVTVIGVLTGCLIFLADLIRRLDLPLRIHLIQASSYRGAVTRPGELHLGLDGLPDLTGREVLLVDDILDTGRTLRRVVDELTQRRPARIRVAVLLHKVDREEVRFRADYVGFDIPDVFVVGYGLDYNDEYRHLPHLAVLSVAETGQPNDDSPLPCTQGRGVGGEGAADSLETLSPHTQPLSPEVGARGEEPSLRQG